MMIAASNCLPGESLRGCACHSAALLAAILLFDGASIPAKAVSRSPKSMRGVCERAMAPVPLQQGVQQWIVSTAVAIEQPVTWARLGPAAGPVQNKVCYVPINYSENTAVCCCSMNAEAVAEQRTCNQWTSSTSWSHGLLRGWQATKSLTVSDLGCFAPS